MKDPHRQEIGYRLAGRLSKYTECGEIHRVNTKLVSFGYSRSRCYTCRHSYSQLGNCRCPFGWPVFLHKGLFSAVCIAYGFMVRFGSRNLMGSLLLTWQMPGLCFFFHIKIQTINRSSSETSGAACLFFGEVISSAVII